MRQRVTLVLVVLAVLVLTLQRGVAAAGTAAAPAQQPGSPPPVPSGVGTPGAPVKLGPYTVPPGAAPADGQIANVTVLPANWYTGHTVKAQWEWPGHATAPADVSLWSGTQQVAVIASSRPNLSAPWVVPYALLPGSYTVRVQSHANPANRAERPVTVLASALTAFTAPPPNAVLVSGLPFTFGWQYVGQPGPLKIQLLRSGYAPITWADNRPPGTLGVGQFSTSLNLFPGQYHLQLTSLAHPAITLTSPVFTVKNPGVKVFAPTHRQAFKAGQQIQVPFEFYKTHSTAASGGNLAELILWRRPSLGFGQQGPCGGPYQPACPPSDERMGVLATVPAQHGNNTVTVTLPGAAELDNARYIEVKEVGTPSSAASGYSGIFFVSPQ